MRFAPSGQSAPGTPGLPVISDTATLYTTDDKWGPTSCDDIASPRSYDYLDCGQAVPAGSPSTKVWPVIYAAGQTLTINQVVFVASRHVQNPQLTATVSVSGPAPASLSLPATTLRQAKVGSKYQLSADSLTFTGSLPGVPGRDQMTITWTVADATSGQAVKTVKSQHVIYLTAGTYVAAQGVAEGDRPYETVLDTGTVAASGASGEQNVFNAIWKKFQTLQINHPILDPATGAISYGRPIKYYHKGYITPSDEFNMGIGGGCPSVIVMLRNYSGHCGSWAMFFAMVMAYQGISAQAIVLKQAPGFQRGPAPGGCTRECRYMLVGPKLWHFNGGTAGGNYPFRDELTVTGGTTTTVGTMIDITGGELTYSSTSAIAQGPVSTPPMWFKDGDHEIDEVTLPNNVTDWVDPSYGLGPYANVKDYEPHAIAGFAVIYKDVGGKLTPLDVDPYDKAGIIRGCTGTNVTCYFQASEGIQQ